MTTSTVGRADSAASRSLRAMPRDVTVALDADTTRALVEGVPRAFGRTMQEALLAALARTIGEWSGRDRIVIDLESQGRSADLAPDLDVSRTVGWFTNVFPLRLPVVDGLMSAQVDAVAERLAAVPRDGIGYGLLRYLTPSAAQVTAVDTDGRRDVEAGFATPVEILFNYLGQLDLVLDRGALLAPADDPVGSSDSGARELPHLIAINCAVRGGRLSASWTTDARIYHESTIARLADRFVSHLRALVAESRTAARPAARDRSDPPVFDGDIAAVLAELQGD